MRSGEEKETTPAHFPPDVAQGFMEPQEQQQPQPEPATHYPWWVRRLAALYYLSMILGPLGFFALSLTAMTVWLIRKQWDGLVLGLAAGALACPLAAGHFRTWFEQWGRRHYPSKQG